MRKNRSKIAALILSILLCFTFAGCSSGTAGKSAYEIACDNGFVGTEQEWLDSLVGTNGENGINGRDGADAAGINIYELFDAYVEVHPGTTFEEFLNAFLIVDYYDTEIAAAKAMCSVVRVRSRFPKSSGGISPTTSTSYAHGSGVVYRIEDGYAYIITNYHVVYDYDSATANKIADEISVYPYGATDQITAEFAGGSVNGDIAVIKISAASLPEFVKAVTKADSNGVAPGMRAVAVGNPLAEGISVTSGVVSVDSEYISMEALNVPNGTVSIRAIRTDAPINSGNSGGGLFNARGELIGIVNAKTVSSGVENVGFAIPSNIAAGIADCVIDNNSKKALLGVMTEVISQSVRYNSALSKTEIIDTVKVTSISSGAFAEGSLLPGDILLSVRLNDGETMRITRLFHLPDFLYKARTGDNLYITVERNGAEEAVQLTVQNGNLNNIE